MTAIEDSIPYRPLGIIKTVLDKAGFQITHCYEDLIFIEHNAFLLRMEEQGEDISLIFNCESESDKRDEIATLLKNEGSEVGLRIITAGTYKMTPNEETSTIDISFQD